MSINLNHNSAHDSIPRRENQIIPGVSFSESLIWRLDVSRIYAFDFDFWSRFNYVEEQL